MTDAATCDDGSDYFMNTTGNPRYAPTIHVHTWHRVPAHIATIAFEYPNEKSYNAACECGATEWVHWTPVKEEE